MDYRRFLGKKETRVLPFFGGHRLDAPDRRLRLDAPPEKPGFYRFEIEGRSARVLEAAEPEFGELPKVRGHLQNATLFVTGAPPEEPSFLPEGEPEPFTPCVARRWTTGEVVFESFEFDGDAEVAARLALEEDRTLAGEKGTPPSLRAAFGWAVLGRVSRRLGVTCSAVEAWRALGTVADEGAPAAERLLIEIAERRRDGRIVIRDGARARLVDVGRIVAGARDRADAAVRDSPEDRAEAALEKAGARMLAVRRLETGMLEVTFRYANQRFVTLADPRTLRVIDAGICLVDHMDGHRGDEELTLESLPSVIREAIDLGALVITRR
jgi:hypothetical protein